MLCFGDSCTREVPVESIFDPEEFDCEAVNDRLPGRRVLVKADGGTRLMHS